MAEGGFFDRLFNLWRGFWSQIIGGVEQKNPEAVYDSAIEQRITQYKNLKKTVGDIVYLRNKLSDELAARQKELAEVNAQLPVAVESGDDEVALLLLQRKNELERQIGESDAELQKISKQADDAKEGLQAFQIEVDKLKREKDAMMAKKASAEARIKIEESLAGISTDADIKALTNVREHIEKLHAQADVGQELKSNSIDERLKKIKEKAGDAAARSQLDELKKQMAARQAAAQGEAAKKTL